MADPRGTIQFSLLHLLVAIAVCASLLGYLASQNRTYDVAFYCFRLPSSDDELADWYEDQDGVEEARITREGKEFSVHLQLRTSGGIADSTELPTPPMRELGYGIESIGFGNASTLGGLVQRLQALAGTVPVAGWGIVAIFSAALGILVVVFRSRKAPR